MTDEREWLAALEADLRKKVDRKDPLPKLSMLSVSNDPEIKNNAVWCVAKMAQNKVADKAILNILIPLGADSDPQIKENVAWGIGEISGTGVSDPRSVNVIVALLSDNDKMVRGMAAWAAGRLIHRLGENDLRMTAKLKELENDTSEYVRSSAAFALRG